MPSRWSRVLTYNQLIGPAVIAQQRSNRPFSGGCFCGSWNSTGAAQGVVQWWRGGLWRYAPLMTRAYSVQAATSSPTTSTSSITTTTVLQLLRPPAPTAPTSPISPITLPLSLPLLLLQLCNYTAAATVATGNSWTERQQLLEFASSSDLQSHDVKLLSHASWTSQSWSLCTPQKVLLRSVFAVKRRIWFSGRNRFRGPWGLHLDSKNCGEHGASYT